MTYSEDDQAPPEQQADAASTKQDDPQALAEQVKARRERSRAAVAPEAQAVGLAWTPTSEELRQCLLGREVAEGRMLARLFDGKYAVDLSSCEWLAFAGSAWEPDLENQAYHDADALVLLYQREAEARRTEQLEFERKGDADSAKRSEQLAKMFRDGADKLNGDSRRQRVLSIAARGKAGIGVREEVWNRHPFLLPIHGGVVDLETLRLRPGDPAHYLRMAAPTPWAESSDCPTWRRFLLDIYGGNEELVAFFQRLVGSCLPRQPKDSFTVLWGQGRNGKSTQLRVIRHVLGPLVGKVRSELFLDAGRVASSSGPTADLMALRDPLVVWAAEADEGRKLSAAFVKELLGGEPMTGREPHGKRMSTFVPTCAPFLLTNEKPSLPAGDYALRKRTVLLPYVMSFVDDPDPDKPNERPKDPYLFDKLTVEASAILRWMCEGCLDWQRQGLNPPAIVRDETDRYAKENDPVDSWLNARCTIDERAHKGMDVDEYQYLSRCIKEGSSKLYDDFARHCKGELGMGNAWSQKRWGNYMAKRFEKHEERGRRVVYLGVGLLAEGD